MNEPILDQLEDIARKLLTQKSANEEFTRRLRGLAVSIDIADDERLGNEVWEIKTDPREFELEGLLVRRLHTSLATLTASSWKLAEDALNFSLDLKKLFLGAKKTANGLDFSDAGLPVSLQQAAAKWLSPVIETSNPNHRIDDLIDPLRGSDPTIVASAKLVVGDRLPSSSPFGKATVNNITITTNDRQRPGVAP